MKLSFKCDFSGLKFHLLPTIQCLLFTFEGMPGYLVPPPVDIDNQVEVIETPMLEIVRDNPDDILPGSDDEGEEIEDEDEAENEEDEHRNIFNVLFN